MVRHRIPTLGLSALTVLAMASPLTGQVIAYDPFNQTAPFQLNGTASSGVPWPTTSTWGFAVGNGGVVVPGSLSYGPLQTAGNRAQMNWFAGNNASDRSLGPNRGGAGNNFWLSFLSDVTQINQGLSLYQDSTQQMRIGVPPSGTSTPLLGIDLFAGVTGGTTQVALANPTILADGTPRFFVLHFEMGQPGNTNTLTLYVNPDPSSLGTGSAPTGGSVATFSTALDFPFNNLLIGNFSGVSGSAGAFTVDEIRIGPTWASVSPVPEPSTLLLTIGGLAAMFLRPDRRAKSAKSTP